GAAPRRRHARLDADWSASRLTATNRHRGSCGALTNGSARARLLANRLRKRLFYPRPPRRRRTNEAKRKAGLRGSPTNRRRGAEQSGERRRPGRTAERRAAVSPFRPFARLSVATMNVFDRSINLDALFKFSHISASTQEHLKRVYGSFALCMLLAALGAYVNVATQLFQ
ncbi:bax inhibitor 1, partial [Lagopus leucura]|uniref:bax inhibitor 1 n=1 Tax=Lagopus leucura TaxID=30410 RepID=UPI001C679D91